MSDDAPQAGQYRPDARAHLTRTAVILALIGALLLATGWLAWEIKRPGLVIPPGYMVQPYDGGSYDPGLYTPFTRAPEPGR